MRTESVKSSVGKLNGIGSAIDRYTVQISESYVLAVLEERRSLDLGLTDGSDLLDEGAERMERPAASRQRASKKEGGVVLKTYVMGHRLMQAQKSVFAYASERSRKSAGACSVGMAMRGTRLSVGY